MNPSITNRSLAKARFFAIYGLSVLLIVLLLSSFFIPGKKEATSVEPTGSHRTVIIERLHERFVPLQSAAVYAIENGASAEMLHQVDVQKTSFLAVVDSLRRVTAGVQNEDEKAALHNLLDSFALSAEREQQVLHAFASKASDKHPITASATSDELEELKVILAQKEEKIAALEQQKQLVQPGNSNTVDSEWKEKYNTLKSMNEKTASQLDAIKESYKEVVEDNRRLIAQLQAARTGKN